MIFSNHALLRFVQRVVEIEDESEALKYIEVYKYEVYYELLKLINESDVLFHRFSIDGEGKSYKYLIKGDILIIISPAKNVVVSLYDIKVDSNEEANSEKVREYTKRIKRNKDAILKKESKKNENDMESRKLEYIIEHKERELEQLKSELNCSIDISKHIAAETKNLRHESRALMRKIMFGFKKLL